MRETLCAVLLGVAAVGFAACDDGGGPNGPTPVVPPVVDMQSDEAAARQSVEAWLSLIDAGNYTEAYDATGSYFRENVAADEFRNIMEERVTAVSESGEWPVVGIYLIR